MIDGQFVMRNRKVRDRWTRHAIIAEADRVGKRIWGRVLAAGPLPLPGRPGTTLNHRRSPLDSDRSGGVDELRLHRIDRQHGL